MKELTRYFFWRWRRQRKKISIPTRARNATPPIVPPIIAAILTLLGFKVAVAVEVLLGGVILFASVLGGIEVVVGEDVDVWDEVLELVVVMAMAETRLNVTLVYTTCRSISEGCPEYVVSTVVAQLDAPQPY